MEPRNNVAPEPRTGWVRRILFPLVVMFRQGTDPTRMAESVAFGTFLGILPLPGLNSIICAVVALRRGLNMGAIQAVNWLVFPLQIGLFLPMSRLGALALHHQPMPGSFDRVRSLLNSGPAAFFKTIGFGFLDATLAWCVVGIPVCWLLFLVMRHFLERRAGRVSSGKRDSRLSFAGLHAGLNAISSLTMTTPIPANASIRQPLRYIAFWQAMSFAMVTCALWACETFGLMHDGPSDFKRLAIPTALLFLGAFIAVAHTYLQERQVLHGLIAICAYCHKVRVDDNAWKQVEKFVSEHSRAEFTHGVCPECFQKLTGDLTRKEGAGQEPQGQRRDGA